MCIELLHVRVNNHGRYPHNMWQPLVSILRLDQYWNGAEQRCLPWHEGLNVHIQMAQLEVSNMSRQEDTHKIAGRQMGRT